MKSRKLGKPTSAPEIMNVSLHGIWVLVGAREYLLSYKDYPWFKNATISDIHNVDLVGEKYLRWPTLDVDLGLESLEAPESFPLVARGKSK